MHRILLLLMLSLLAGCDPMAITSTRVMLPIAAKSGNGEPKLIVASTNAAPVLDIVDSLMTSKGLERLTTNWSHKDNLLAAYEKVENLYAPFSCNVYEENNAITVVFLEMGRLKPSRSVRDLNVALKKILAERYGVENVK